MKDIFTYWPKSDFSIRKTQETVLNWLQKQPSTIKHFICEMPVGTGKSLIGLTFANWQGGNSVIFTPQKILQKQYEDTFGDDIFALYGKNNYTCKSINSSCEIGSLVFKDCNDCPYRAALANAHTKKHIVLNYMLGFLLAKNSKDINFNLIDRNTFVFDECHNMEKFLTEVNATTISDARCNQMNIRLEIFNKDEQVWDWLQNVYIYALNNELDQMEDSIKDLTNKGNLNKGDVAIVKKYKDLDDQLKSLSDLKKTTFSEFNKKFVIIKDKKYYKIKELNGSNVFTHTVQPLAKKFIHMSSTILDYKAYCRDIGIDPNEAAFISTDSEFNKDNRPIFYMPRVKMTYGWDKPENASNRQGLIEGLISLCNEEHGNDSGIIHTGNYAVAKWLVSELTNMIPHKIYHHLPDVDFGSENRDAVLSEFQIFEDRPKILISPSITEGLDLLEDKSRFAITVKIPFPSIADEWIKRKMELSYDWYTRQTMIQVIQATGRIVRSPGDWGANYIVDSSFEALYKKTKKIIPNWWKESLINA